MNIEWMEIRRQEEIDKLEMAASEKEDGNLSLEQWESFRKIQEHKIRVCNGAIRALRK